ncbi:MAG: hypothetical protein FJ278_09540, partial [Planctomycetes bacterium]|nr:hypothetical protein [Planctomycetota bacterium]
AEWHLAFEGDARIAGREPAEATAIALAPGKEGQGISLKRGSRLACDPADLSREEFTADFWVKHPKPLRDYFYREMTYLYHETADEKNRIGFVKRSATSYFVFYFGNAQGGGKGQNFSGNWFALKTPVFDWPADTWHRVTLTASKAARRAQVVIDGQLCAEATGDQFPERWGERLWIGSRKGASPVEGVLDELRIEPPKFAEGLPKAHAAHSARPEPQRHPRRRGGKELTLNLDFFDICIGTDCWDMEDCAGEMDRIMRLCAHYGVDRVLFRVSVCGAVCYRSKAVQACEDACFEKYHREILDTPIGNLPSFIPNMAEVMRRMDPLAEAVKAGHRYGVEVWGWSTIFDSMYYAPPGEFFREHPEYTWQSRDGTKFIPGVPCYAYPEVRAYRMAEMREMLEYGVDGLYLSIRSHSPWPNRGSREYGYNPPVVAEYQQRYGSDPRQAEPDSLAEIRFVKLKGEHLTRFLRDVKAEAVKFGKPVAINASGDGVDPVNAGRMFVDFDTLARERTVDELCLISGASADLTRWRMLSDGKVKLTVFAGIHGKTYERCLPLLRDGILAMLKNPTSDGACFHELGNAYYLDLWEEGIAEAYKAWAEQSPKAK